MSFTDASCFRIYDGSTFAAKAPEPPTDDRTASAKPFFLDLSRIGVWKSLDQHYVARDHEALKFGAAGSADRVRS